MNVLIPFTGGRDSSYLLYDRLMNTADIITAFRMDCRMVPSIAQNHKADCPRAEEIAAARVVDWLKRNARDFTYEVVDVAAFEPGEWESIHCARLGAARVNSGEFDRLLIARMAESASPHRGVKTKARQIAVFNEISSRGALEFPLLDKGYGKPHITVLTPPGLAALTLVCKRPKVLNGEIVACGRCQTGCAYRSMIDGMIAKGFTPDAILDYRLRKKRAGKYAGLPGADPVHAKPPLPSSIYFPGD